MNWRYKLLGLPQRPEEFADKAIRKGWSHRVNLSFVNNQLLQSNHPSRREGRDFETIATITVRVGKSKKVYSETFSVAYGMDGHQGNTEYQRENQFREDMKTRVRELENLFEEAD